MIGVQCTDVARGRTTGCLPSVASTQNCDSGESVLGNLIADAQRAAMNSDVAMTNSGGIRADLPPRRNHLGPGVRRAALWQHLGSGYTNGTPAPPPLGSFHWQGGRLAVSCTAAMKLHRMLGRLDGLLGFAIVATLGCSGESSANNCNDQLGTAGSNPCAGAASLLTGGSTLVGGTQGTAGRSSSGGRSATGGSLSAGGTTAGNSSATGGTAGASTIASGGTAAGATATGGAGGLTTTAGSSALGGSTTSGGTATTGGLTGTGGSTTPGGTATAGGATALGGTSTAGGVPNTGGTTTTAGASSTGGAASTGGTPSITGGATNGGNSSSPACQVAPQSGCPGGACDLDLTRLDVGGTTCRTIVNAGTELSSCTSLSDCAAGYLCLGNSCTRYCAGDGDCSAPGGKCVVTLNTNGNVPIPGISLCSPNCNPLTAAGCPTGSGCGVYLATDGVRRYTSCHAASTGTQGSACTSDLDCGPGFGCISFTTNGTATLQCMQFCLTTAPVCPTGTTNCLALNPAAIVGSSNYGICH